MNTQMNTQPSGSCCVLAALIALTSVALPAHGDWVAYNDGVGAASVPNTTNFTPAFGDGGGFEDNDGLLVDFSTGLPTSVLVTASGSNISGSIGAMPNAGTDAYSLFNGILDLNDSASYNSSGSDWYIEYAFTGLNPLFTYEFLTTANRNSISYDGAGAASRWTKFSLLGADAAANASSVGVADLGGNVLEMNTGYNSVNGYLAGWEGINPGADGTIVIRSENVGIGGPGEAVKSYGIQGFSFSETIPEPSTTLLSVAGLAALALRRRRR
jgi:hypothetical protein